MIETGCDVGSLIPAWCPRNGN